MKTIILTIALAITGLMGSAQNLIGYSQSQLEAYFNKKQISYENYYSKNGNLCYKYGDENEVRIYNISPIGKCNSYSVFSSYDSFKFDMIGYLLRNGYVYSQKMSADGARLYKNSKLKTTAIVYDCSFFGEDEGPELAKEYVFWFIIAKD